VGGFRWGFAAAQNPSADLLAAIPASPTRGIGQVVDTLCTILTLLGGSS
jgi:hypothetical protein